MVIIYKAMIRCSGIKDCEVYKEWAKKFRTHDPYIIKGDKDRVYSCIACKQITKENGCERVLFLNLLEKILKNLGFEK